MRIAFFGSSRFSCLVLDKLLGSNHEIACVVTQPDQPAGRKMQLLPTVVCQDSSKAGLPVLKPEKLKGNKDFRRELRSFKPEAFITASYGKIIPKSVLEVTDWPLNVHPSLLPKLRGASPIRSALLEGLSVTGCCIMRMTPRLDDGDLLGCRELAVDADWNHEELETVLGGMGGAMAVDALSRVEQGRAKLTPQNHDAATYCGLHTKADAKIDWSRSAAELYDFIRAWDPDIGAWTTLQDGSRFKVWRSAVWTGVDVSCDGLQPGVIAAATHKRLIIATGDGGLNLIDVQPENRKRMPIGSFLAGSSAEAGQLLGSAS